MVHFTREYTVSIRSMNEILQKNVVCANSKDDLTQLRITSNFGEKKNFITGICEEK